MYSCTISALQIHTLVLHTLLFRVSNHIANNFISNIIPPEIPPPTNIQCISNCFTLQPLPAKHTWHTAYQLDSDKKKNSPIIPHLMLHLINPRSSTSRKLFIILGAKKRTHVLQHHQLNQIITLFPPPLLLLH